MHLIQREITVADEEGFEQLPRLFNIINIISLGKFIDSPKIDLSILR